MNRRPRWLLTVSILALLALVVLPAAAQDEETTTAPEPTPAAADGHWAAGGDLGWIFAMDSAFDGGFLIDGFVEYRQSPRLSWRGMLLATSVDGPGEDIDLVVLTGNVFYEWHTKKVRPFATAGIGAYRYDRSSQGSSVKFGMNVGGGVNIPVARKLDVKVEADLHGVSSREPDSFFLLSAGLRYRF